MPERWCLRQDDDCHWYLIPSRISSKFDALVAEFGDDEMEYFSITFDEYRLPCSPSQVTFENPMWPGGEKAKEMT